MAIDLIKKETVEKELLHFEGVTKDYPFDKQTAVYYFNSNMFALIREDSSPLRISLLCDPKLSETLRQKYETVMPGERLNPKHWNTIILTGQLGWEKVQGLIRHAYEETKSVY